MHTSLASRFPALRGAAAWLFALAAAFVLAGCAGLPPRAADTPVLAIPPSSATLLGRAAAHLDAPRDGLSSVRPLIEASFALDARLELIRRAQSSIDVQTYQLGNDKTGRLLLRELRDAARRGVRVRLLLDDFYTAGMDPLLLGLAAESNASVRLFNPFVNARDHSATRWMEFLGDFRRLNHRTPAVLKADFETATSLRFAPWPDPPGDGDVLGDPPLGLQLLNIPTLQWMRADAHATADSPNKALGVMRHPTESVAQRFHELAATARSSVLVISPYFIPGDEGMARIREGRRRGVQVSVITNSLADSDEPLVNINYNRYRVDMLKLGVELYEVSTQQLKRSGQFRDLLKKARGRLHAKLALIDREWVMLGSMNLDPRSALLNTEFGVRVRSFDLTQALLYAYQLDDIEGVYRVVLKPDGENVQWIGTGDVNNEVLDSEPDSSMLTRLQLLLFSWFVPTDQL